MIAASVIRVYRMDKFLSHPRMWLRSKRTSGRLRPLMVFSLGLKALDHSGSLKQAGVDLGQLDMQGAPNDGASACPVDGITLRIEPALQ
ncbi:hypothetical protein [Bradyrhizobium shewense]|uniref:hypothetical protein n=1 Tax=Bradyrhizobium shewense TaxID=1761772 RepID=UPI000B87BF23|nr:hypothetical protein [Bradyrhizobium shewense]